MKMKITNMRGGSLPMGFTCSIQMKNVAHLILNINLA